MWNLKRNDTDELTEQKQIHRLRANLWLLGGMGEGIESLGWSCAQSYI